MNSRQRSADSDMAYLGRAWRIGFSGPREKPVQTTLWEQIREQIRSLPPEFDQERVWTLHAQWLRVAEKSRYYAVMLKLHYRDNYEFQSEELLTALDLFARA